MSEHYLNEAALQDTIIKHIKQRYQTDVWIFKSHDLCTVGVPDLIICLLGHFIAIELKAGHRPAQRKGTSSIVDPYKGASSLQKYNIKRINMAGGSAFIGRSLGGVLDKLDQIVESIRNGSKE